MDGWMDGWMDGLIDCGTHSSIQTLYLPFPTKQPLVHPRRAGMPKTALVAAQNHPRPNEQRGTRGLSPSPTSFSWLHHLVLSRLILLPVTCLFQPPGTSDETI